MGSDTTLGIIVTAPEIVSAGEVDRRVDPSGRSHAGYCRGNTDSI
jgi:hypothetical protein